MEVRGQLQPCAALPPRKKFFVSILYKTWGRNDIRADMDLMEKRKTSFLCQESNPNCNFFQS
jgi:hypothetical protein